MVVPSWIGGVAEAEVAVYSVPLYGPDVILATTRYGPKSSSVPIRKRFSGESSDWWAFPSGEISCPRASRSSSSAA